MVQEDQSSGMKPEAFGQAIIVEAERRLFEDSLPRLKKCLAVLNETETWRRPNEETVSVGNLVLHLCGNVRQWIISRLGGVEDVRNRSAEFLETGPMSSEELIKRLEETMTEARTVLQQLNPASLIDPVAVQGFDETGISVLMHVVEHFSYHVGQITFYVKTEKNIDLRYHEGRDLDTTGSSVD